jgi:hypothetical protein
MEGHLRFVLAQVLEDISDPMIDVIQAYSAGQAPCGLQTEDALERAHIIDRPGHSGDSKACLVCLMS